MIWVLAGLFLFAAALGPWLTTAPSSIQTNPIVKPFASILVGNAGTVLLIGLAILALGIVFLRRK